MATTYTTLLAEAASYLGRADLTALIPGFVQFAQARINREVRAREMQTTNAAFSINAEYVNLPTDLLQVKSFYITTGVRSVIEPADSGAMTTDYTTSGRPRWFSVEGTQFRFSPIPDATYTATLIYFAKPATLVASSQETNTLFPTVAPDLYLYATLLEAEPFIMNDPRIAVWSAAYDRGVANLNAAAKGSKHGGPLTTRAS